jgi:predicted metal-dependent hydrolase
MRRTTLEGLLALALAAFSLPALPQDAADFKAQEASHARIIENYERLLRASQKAVEAATQGADEVARLVQGKARPDQLLAATKQMRETQMSFNLQYLQLQSQMQNENRSYTAISNIMKTKHDTVKNSISNVR